MSWLQRFFRFREKSNPEAVKPFLEHLEDLRWTVIKMGAALAVAMVVAFSFSVPLTRLIQAPLNRVDPQLVTELKVFGVVDPLIISIQLAFYSGILLAFPFLFYFLAQFVVPALTHNERRTIIPAIFIGFALFLSGVWFGYRLLPATLGFFFTYARSYGWQPYWTVREYFSFVTHFLISIGLAFQLPVLVFVLVRLGILSFALMNRTRTFAVPLIFVLAAILAPTPDPLTLLALGTPMCLLYEACIWIAWLVERRNRQNASAEKPASQTGTGEVKASSEE